jgi:tRNA nucleotidyltransferase (CCA-adding enzyme)
MNISSRIEVTLLVQRRDLLRLVAEDATARRLPLYAVGGFARDLLLGRRVRDFDLVLEGDVIPFARALSRIHGGHVTAHTKFHTATWFLPPNLVSDARGAEALDFISARSETYARPAALPTVKLGVLTDDLHRRDFTVNAMAVRLDGVHFGELTDPLGGRADLERALVRVLHPNSFVDDPTRLFRAVRYAERYGFKIASESEALIPTALVYVDKLSPERLRHELDLIFEEDDAVPMMEKLWALGIVQAVRPALPSEEATRARFQLTRSLPSTIGNKVQFRWMVWLLGLSGKEIRTLAKRLYFTADLLKKITAAASIYQDVESLAGMRPSECVKRLDGLPEDSLMAACFSAPPSDARSMLEKYFAKWKNVKPFMDGDALKQMGVPFGPRIGEILWCLRAAWLDEEVTSKEEERTLVEKMKNERRKRA